jgi:hypothetical protein
LFISCEKAARLESESKDRTLSAAERFQLGFHMAMCKLCRTYRAQLDVLSRLSRQAGERAISRPDAGLSPEGRDRIKERLRSAI